MMRHGLILCLCAGLVACAGGGRRQLPPAPPSVQGQLQNILKLSSQKQKLARLQTFVQGHRGSDVFEPATLALAQLQHRAKNYKAAYSSLLLLLDARVVLKREAQVRLQMAQNLKALQRYDEVLSVTHPTLGKKNLSPSMLTNIYKLRYQAAHTLGQALETLQALVHLYKFEKKYRHRLQALELVRLQLGPDELKLVARDKTLNFAQAAACLRMAGLEFELRNYSAARSWLRKTQPELLGEDASEQHQSLHKQLQALKRTDYLSIGVVLPMSGRQAEVSHKILRGLQLALELVGPTPSAFKLAILDSQAKPEAARQAALDLVLHDHVVAVVGSLSSRTALPVAQVLQSLGVPNISLSQRSSLTDVGEFIFRSAVTPQLQAQALARTAVERGLKQVAILHPEDNYGSTYARLFTEEFEKLGGTVGPVQTYDAKSTDFNTPVAKLIQTYDVKERLHEYREKKRQWQEENKNKSRARFGSPSEVLDPIVEFDAVFIPEQAKRMQQIVASLLYYEVKDIKLLGPNFWNSPEFVRRAGRMAEHSFFVDVPFSLQAAVYSTDFKPLFQRHFAYRPGKWEARGFDVGRLLKQGILDGHRTRQQLQKYLLQVRNFKGALGVTSASPRRELTPELVGLTVRDGQILRATKP